MHSFLVMIPGHEGEAQCAKGERSQGARPRGQRAQGQRSR